MKELEELVASLQQEQKLKGYLKATFIDGGSFEIKP